MAGYMYVNAVFGLLSASNFQPERQAISVILENWTYLLFDWSKLLFFGMCLLRINLPNLCPDMNQFDAVDFSECHSERSDKFLLTLSVLCTAFHNPELNSGSFIKTKSKN